MKLFDIIKNFFLVKKYPFLKPSLGYGCDMHYHRKGYKYHYEETWLDCLPTGWRKAFGLKLCQELNEVIKRCNLKDYAISQVKEKFGTLCWYDEGGNEETRNITLKYMNESSTICQKCGKPAEYVTTGWIGYYCSECSAGFKDKQNLALIKLNKEIEKAHGK